MCGRTACTLAPDEICQACSVLSTNNNGQKHYVSPEWKDHPGKYTYSPSTNIAPSAFTPILYRFSNSLSKKRDVEGNDKMDNEKLLVQPMMWGMIPHFYRGDTPYGHGYKTNNCRIEDIEEKKIFKPALVKGRRCVVISDGFYEWQSTKGEKDKQPYFIHSPQEKGIEIWNKDSWPKDPWSEDEGWKGGNLLKMAGLYSVWNSSDGEVYSYTIITMESGEKLSWLHHRIPAILETPEDVKTWLEEEDYKKALSNLRNNPNISSYTVSKQVNNSRNKDENLHAPFTGEEKKPSSASSKFMAAWLNSAKNSSTKKEKE